jgi:hypothetical protein
MITSYGSIETSVSGSQKYTAKSVETLVTFIFKYRPLGMVKKAYIFKLIIYFITRLEMLRANDIIPRNPEPLKSQAHALETPPASETSSRKGEYTKVKSDVESGSDDEDSLNRREKALLVCFRF